jgi:FAD/FMN-containing dehydrogenase
MQRRALLIGTAAAIAGALAGHADALGPPASPATKRRLLRRVRPGDPDWPSDADWRRLRADVGGALTVPTDLWADCRSAADVDRCRRSFGERRNPYFLGDQAAGTQVYGYLDGWQTAPSVYAVAARSTADVTATVRFARDHRLRLVVKGGGHSYLGGSNAPDSLLLWTHALRDVVVHDAFQPAGVRGNPVAAVSVGAGALWMEVYDAVTTRHGRYVQGGGCTTVGVAGLVLGGGFGSFSKGFGLGAAGLLEAELVTADGTVRVVNEARDPDLFWALRGGGGGTFGVVTRLTLATHPLPGHAGSAWGAVQAADEAAFARLLEAFLRCYAASLMNPAWGEQVKLTPGNVLEISMVCQGIDEDAVAEAWREFRAYVDAPANRCTWQEPFGSGVRDPRTWWDAVGRKAAGSTSFRFDDRPGADPRRAWWSGDSEQVSAFLYGYDSLWLPADLLSDAERGPLAAALVRASRRLPVGLHFNKGLAGAPDAVRAAARATPVHPACAEAFALAIVATGGAPPLPGLGRPFDAPAARAEARAVREAGRELRALVGTPACYVSESDYHLADWREEFWGPHYPRLRAIKDRFDPDGLFYVHHGVGSEDWSDDGFERVT